jgi:4,5-DOPA dioxygenase extradiol
MDLDRRAFLLRAAILAVAATTGGCFGRGREEAAARAARAGAADDTGLMPTLFVGHGTPMNAIEDNVWSRGFRALGEAVPTPRAILSVSAHWFLPSLLLTADEHPETIHDFAGFPQELADARYPAPGSPALARRVCTLIDGAAPSSAWGLDHGTWSVLRHLRPAADCPVVQLSVDAWLDPAGHLALARALAPLRRDGILIMGSGNITHNLRWLRDAAQTGDPLTTPDWAARFDRDVAQALTQRDHTYLARALQTDDGARSHPTPDHYLPLLYAVGAASPDEAPSFPITGFDLGMFSMRAVRFG